MVRALAFHQCGPGLIPGPGVICGLCLLLVRVLAPRVFLRALRFSSLHKSQHFQIPIRPGRQVFTHEALAREIRRLLPHYDVKFDLPFFIFTSLILVTCMCYKGWFSLATESESES